MTAPIAVQPADVISGPIDPDPPPPPKALLDVARKAKVVDSHLQVDGVDRWVTLTGSGWLLAGSPAEGFVNIDAWTLDRLRSATPAAANRIQIEGEQGSFAVRPVLRPGGGRGAQLYVGLCPA